MTYGWNASAYQILNPGIEYWFGKDVGAVVGYVLRGGYVRVRAARYAPPMHYRGS